MNSSFSIAPSIGGWTNSLFNVTDADESSVLHLTTTHVWNRTLAAVYYSFSPITMILTAIPVVFIIIVIVFGNALVVLAVLSQERLKRKTQNWLIVSLAVADLLVGLLIMPFTLTYELLGRWTFGRAFCEMWLALDVLFVTASIMNLCAISIDRYWSLTDPVHYSAVMSTPKARIRILIMIVCSWLLAFLICLPPLVGWRPEHGLQTAVEELEMGGGCNLSGDVGYVLYSALGSFFVPLSIVVFIYAKIFLLTRRRIVAQRRKAKQRENLLLVDAPITKLKKSPDESISLKDGNRSTDSPNSPLQQPQSPINHETNLSMYLTPLHCASVGTQTEINHLAAQSRTSLISRVNTTQTLADDCDTLLVSDQNTVFTNKGTVKKSSASNAQDGARVAGGGKVNVCAPSLLLKPLELQLRMMQQRKGVRKRERQATLVLGLILGAFVLSWMPFFCSYVLSAICCQTPEIIFDIIFWLGYCNSGLNPFIYNFFNPDFRNAFRKILCRKG